MRKVDVKYTLYKNDNEVSIKIKIEKKVHIPIWFFLKNEIEACSSCFSLEYLNRRYRVDLVNNYYIIPFYYHLDNINEEEVIKVTQYVYETVEKLEEDYVKYISAVEQKLNMLKEKIEFKYNS